MERLSDDGLPGYPSPSGRAIWHRLDVLALTLALALLGWFSYRRVHDRDVPLSIVRQLPGRLDRLRPGMTEQEVWQALGLGRHRPEPTVGGGPVKEFGITYSLRQDCGITLYRDGTDGTNHIVRVLLHRWPEGVVGDRRLTSLCSGPGPPSSILVSSRIPSAGRSAEH